MRFGEVVVLFVNRKKGTSGLFSNESNPIEEKNLCCRGEERIAGTTFLHRRGDVIQCTVESLAK